MDFPFHETYKLDDYKDWCEPCVFFGNYRYEDFRIITQNIGYKKIFWTGQDVLDFKYWYFLYQQPQYYGNVTAHPKIHQLISNQNVPCTLVPPAAFGNKVKPQKLGTKIYAYCPSSAPDYHGKKIIDELRCGGYEIVIGDGQFTQTQWKSGLDDMHYNQCFIGLCLSEFAGGGGSIIEMGLRGMKVVTNVFDLPNCIAWNGIHDVIQAIEDQKKLIGQTKASVANYTWEKLDHKHEWLNI